MSSICRRGCLVLAVALLAATTVWAQQPPNAAALSAAQQEALAKLSYMEGTWEGEGWMDLGGGRKGVFRGSEVITRRLNGTVLMVEGNFFARIPGVQNEVPVHSTIGVISFVPQTKRYRLSTWLATGTAGDSELTLDPRGWHWQIASAAGTARYTMTLSDAGEWLEIGELSADGQKWQKIFEMTLRKR